MAFKDDHFNFSYIFNQKKGESFFFFLKDITMQLPQLITCIYSDILFVKGKYFIK